MVPVEFFEEFRGYFFEMGVPARLKRDAKTLQDFNNFINKYKSQNLYTSVYGFVEPLNYNSAVVDKLFFEFDADDGDFNDELLNDVRRFISFIHKFTDFRPSYFFSGRRGIHVIVHCNTVKLLNPSVCTQVLIENIEKLSGCKFICRGSRNGVAQMRRIPGSKHQGTGLFCIPVSEQDLIDLSADDILNMARHPPTRWFSVKNSYDLTRSFFDVDKKIEDNKLVSNLMPRINMQMINDCIAVEEAKGGVNYGNRDFTLVGLIYYYKNMGLSQNETTNLLIKDWLPLNDPKPDDERWVKYKVKYHYNRFGHACNWFSKANIPLCGECPVRKRMERMEINQDALLPY